jgi:hypothetical protein
VPAVHDASHRSAHRQRLASRSQPEDLPCDRAHNRHRSGWKTLDPAARRTSGQYDNLGYELSAFGELDATDRPLATDDHARCLLWYKRDACSLTRRQKGGDKLSIVHAVVSRK